MASLKVSRTFSIRTMRRRCNSAGKTSVHNRQSTTNTKASEITDTKYLHAFRVFRDEASGCVRFEATARRGPRKSIPIWTAFVTQYIGHKSWMKKVGPATIQFRELHPYIFNEVYRLPKGPTNKYQLTFSKPEGESFS
jgi:hypothetical protein